MISILRPAHRPRCSARQHASSIAITMLSLWLAAFKLLSSYLAIRNGCVSTATVPIAFKLGLAAKRSLYHLDRLPPALRGVQRLANCILAWPYGQACFLSFGPLTDRVAHGASACLNYSNHDAQPMWLAASSRLSSDYFAIRNGCVSTHGDCFIAFQLGLTAKRSF